VTTHAPRDLKFGAYSLPSYHVETDPPQAVFMRDLLDLLAKAEPLGYDHIWLNEHHFTPWGGMLPAPAVLLSALSQRTRHIRLGTSVAVLGLHHPIDVAEQMAMLDLISGGRLEFGIGRGSVVYDYEVMGIDYAEAQARTLESLEVIRQAWTGKPFAHSGEFFQIPSVTVWPTPAQRPHPPIWISCASAPQSFEWTARQGYKLLTIGFVKPVVEFAALTRAYRDAWRAAGHVPGAYEIGTLYHSVVHEDGATARELALGAITRFLTQLKETEALATNPRPARVSPIDNLSIKDLISQSRLVAGSPSEVAEMLSFLQSEVGFTQVDLRFQFGGLSFETARHSMELFAREVMPKLRSRSPVAAG
jgi:alkanesulfonate monooxygenase SsuD/methylene tetrahydromethanopterin reductase-like flavin-dependent oxidoreductase (luciferase family)